MEDLVKAYIELRDQRDAIRDRHKAELAEIESVLEQTELALGGLLAETGAESVKTKFGTVYKSKWTAVKITDFDSLCDYVKQTGRFDLFERRISKTVALELGDVPGTLTETGYKTNVRRS